MCWHPYDNDPYPVRFRYTETTAYEVTISYVRTVTFETL